MAKIKFTKGELKRQRDALAQYERYLPTLQLKKQQLQLEIVHQRALRDERMRRLGQMRIAAEPWAGLLVEQPQELHAWLIPSQIISGTRNIAGVDIPVFERSLFGTASYDLFLTPLWVDTAVEELRSMVSLQEECAVLEKGEAILQQELRVTAQRVNLFEKVKIPETKEAIRTIKIFIGDQLANAVGRSKIAKAKIDENELLEAAV